MSVKNKNNMKIYNVGKVKINLEKNGFPKGLILKRDLSARECRHIMKTLLGIEINTREDVYDDEEYKDYNDELKETVNKWLIGEVDDSNIMEYAYDCSDEPIGIMNLIPIIQYLKKKKIID